MPKLHPLQNSFTAGVISPRLHARSDIEGFVSGLKECNNFVVTKHGPVTTRDGTVFVSNISGDYARTFPFQLSPDSSVGEAFDVVISDSGTLAVLGATGFISGVELLVNTGFGSTLDPWVPDSAGDGQVSHVSGKAILDGGTNPATTYAAITQEVAITDVNDDHTFTFDTETSFANIRPNVKVLIGSTSGADDLGSGSFYGFSGSVVFNAGGNASVFVTLRVEGIVPEMGGDEPVPIEQTSIRKITNTSLRSNVSSAVEFAHPFTATEIRNMWAEMSPDDDIMYLLCGTKAPYKITYTEATDTWEFDVVGFTGTPAEWTGDSFPTCMAFFQGRSWWGGAKAKPQTFWGSKSAAFEDLTAGANDDDAIEFTLNRRGQIRWMEGVRNLIIGTTAGEYIVTSEQGVITPSDVGVDLQSANGGDRVQSLAVGNAVMYVSPDGRKVYKSIYKWTEDSWFSQDLTFTAEHLTESNRILSMAFAKNPESIIWCAMEDGKVLAFTYEPTTERAGWHTHDTDGQVLSISVTERAGTSVVTFVVSRVVDGVRTLSIESMDSASTLDNATLIENETPTKAITGITQLAGLTITPVVDTAVHPAITLDENGDGMLNYEGTNVIVGISYKCRMETLPADIGSQSGSGMGFTKGWSKIWLRLINSLVPKINGDRPADRSPSTPMNLRETAKTQDVNIANLGYSIGAPVIVEQDLPVKTTVAGIFGEREESSL